MDSLLLRVRVALVALPLALCFAFAACSSDDGGASGADTVGGDASAGDTLIGDDAAPSDTSSGPVDTSDDGGGSGPDAADDTGGGDVPTPPALTPSTWCTRWVDEYCAFVASCPVPGQERRTDAQCRVALAGSCVADDVAAAVDGGALAFDGHAAADCLADLADLDCATFQERLRTTGAGVAPACGDVVAGLVPAGGDCRLGTECAAGAFCRFGGTCPGTCAAFATVGADCSGDAWCDFSAAACVGGVCEALPAESGAACVAGACRAPLVCDATSDTCLSPGLAGASCGAGTGVCYPGLLCFGDEGGGGVCQPLRGDGETCFANADCGGADGVALVCAGGTCQPAPGATEPCYDFLCAGDAWCDTAAIPPTCVAFPAPGEACAAGSRCGPTDFCDAGTCRARRPAGEACTAHTQCAEARCYGGVCRPADAPPCAL